MLLLIFILFLGITYALFGVFLQKGWHNIKETVIPASFIPRTTICIIVPVRNEIKNIERLLHTILSQNYPTELMTVYLVDDESADGSTQLMKNWAFRHSKIFRYIEVSDEYKRLKGKKKAIASAIHNTEADLIMTTDADCVLSQNWVRNFVYVFEKTQAVFISGPVKMNGNTSFFGRFQELEFASLVGSGASAIGLGKPLMCNGASLAYSREAYFKIGAFTGSEEIASGDDEFLMHKMSTVFPGKIVFMKNTDSVVETTPSDTISEFIQQRKRWAGKWSHYSLLYVKLLAVWVFFFHFMLIAGLFLCIMNYIDWEWIAFIWAIKAFFDYLYLKQITKFLSIRFKSFIFINSLLIYPWYVVTFGLLSRFGNYVWKERSEALS